MHQVYFERKLSQSSAAVSSRSITPKPFSKIFEESNKSPERLHSEFSQQSTHSPTVTRQKHRNNSSGSYGPSLGKLAAKVKEQVLNTDRVGNRVHQAYMYNAKNTNNLVLDSMRLKGDRSPGIVTKTEPNNDLDTSGQTALMAQKMSKLKADLAILQDRESLYLSKLSSLEKENKSLQRAVEDKEAKLQDLVQKSRDDKLQIQQLVVELEAYKQSNPKQQQWRYDTSATSNSTMRLSELNESTKKIEKGLYLDKTQVTDATLINSRCTKCESATNYCEQLMNRLNEVDHESRHLLKENNALKESLLKAKKVENDILKARNELEKKEIELKGELKQQSGIFNELLAENFAIRKTLIDAMDLSLSSKSDKSKRNACRSQVQLHPFPSSMKALIGAEKILKATS